MKQKVLIADDDVAVHSVIRRLLTREGYNVLDAFDGGEVMEVALRGNPDLIILDEKMPVKKGSEIYDDLRSHYKTRMTPIIFLTGSGSIDARIRGLANGADDYLFKPFDASELLTRIESVIQKSTFYLDANPLTKLPGNKAIEKKMEQLIGTGRAFSVFYADINRFKAFNDRFGFLAGDNVIQKTAEMLVNLAAPNGRFVGHIGGDDFVVISTENDVERFARHITESFEELFSQPDQPSTLSIAVGVVRSGMRQFKSAADVSAVGAEVKAKAKQMGESGFFIDEGV